MEYYDLGTHSWPVTTSAPEAQTWFDRGLIWAYGFNHEEAVYCFEQALSAALRARYAPDDLPGERAVWNSNYAEAIGQVYEAFPGDPDVAALYADALMNLTPWELWDLRTGEPAAGAQTARAQVVLDRALETPAGRTHPGVLHMYIHLMEMSPYPERARPAAER